MDFTGLSAEVLSISHRSDLAAQVDNFALHATERINRRLGLDLVSPASGTDTNDILTNWPLLYIYGTLVALYEYINEGDNVRHYRQAFMQEIDGQNITSTAATETPVMTGA
jgi:hypothetical protein